MKNEISKTLISSILSVFLINILTVTINICNYTVT